MLAREVFRPNCVQRSLWRIKYTRYIGKRGSISYIFSVRCAEWIYATISDTTAVSYSIVNFYSTSHVAFSHYRVANCTKVSYIIIFRVLFSLYIFLSSYTRVFFRILILVVTIVVVYWTHASFFTQSLDAYLIFNIHKIIGLYIGNFIIFIHTYKREYMGVW